jgi:hypothetical protein
MCTLIIALNPSPGVAFVVGANRDERLERPAAGPELRQHGDLSVLCPTDLLAGGTWWGVSSSGVFAAVTNRVATPAPQRRSRGELVLKALEGGDVGGALKRAKELSPEAYNPFHLLVLGVHSGRGVGGIVWSDGVALTSLTLADGAQVLTERSFSAAPDRRSPRILSALSTIGLGAEPAEWITVLGRCLRLPGEGAEDAVDVRLDHLGYGTRSSALAIASTDGAVGLAHADGPPGTAYETLETLVDRLSTAREGQSTRRETAKAWVRDGVAALDEAPPARGGRGQL